MATGGAPGPLGPPAGLPSRREISLIGRPTVLPPEAAVEHPVLERRLETLVTAAEDALAHIDQQERRLPRHLRWRERARARPLTNALWRLVVALVGGCVVLAGIAMLVLPGPGWATIAVGLLILASEFQWADRALIPLRRAFTWLAARWRTRRGRGRSGPGAANR